MFFCCARALGLELPSASSDRATRRSLAHDEATRRLQYKFTRPCCRILHTLLWPCSDPGLMTGTTASCFVPHRSSPRASNAWPKNALSPQWPKQKTRAKGRYASLGGVRAALACDCRASSSRPVPDARLGLNVRSWPVSMMLRAMSWRLLRAASAGMTICCLMAGPGHGLSLGSQPWPWVRDFTMQHCTVPTMHPCVESMPMQTHLPFHQEAGHRCHVHHTAQRVHRLPTRFDVTLCRPHFGI